MQDCCVLVIEDELLIALDLVMTLERAGFPSVEYAATKEQALEMIGQRAWTAVVVDANLNGTGIDQVVTLMREKSTPFVVVTGYGRETLPATVLGAPVLGKPFSPRELIGTVMELCRCRPDLLSIPLPS